MYVMNFAHLDASLVASQFYHLVGAIGVRISSLPGAVRQLGKSMHTIYNADGILVMCACSHPAVMVFFIGQSFYQISVARREVAPTENSWVSSSMDFRW